MFALFVFTELTAFGCLDASTYSLAGILRREFSRACWVLTLSFPVGGFIALDVLGLCWPTTCCGYTIVSLLSPSSSWGLFNPANLCIEPDYLRSYCADLTLSKVFLFYPYLRSWISISLLIPTLSKNELLNARPWEPLLLMPSVSLLFSYPILGS